MAVPIPNIFTRRILEKQIKVITIQRSKGYSTRDSLSIDKIERIIKEIRRIDKKVIIMVL